MAERNAIAFGNQEHDVALVCAETLQRWTDRPDVRRQGRPSEANAPELRSQLVGAKGFDSEDPGDPIRNDGAGSAQMLIVNANSETPAPIHEEGSAGHLERTRADARSRRGPKADATAV